MKVFGQLLAQSIVNTYTTPLPTPPPTHVFVLVPRHTIPLHKGYIIAIIELRQVKND